MYGGCYFHHMVLSGVIVVAALSAQIAACSQITPLVSALTPPLARCHRLPPACVPVLYFPANGPVGSIKQSCFQSGVNSGLRGLYVELLLASSKCHQATQKNEPEKVALLLSSCIISHSQ